MSDMEDAIKAATLVERKPAIGYSIAANIGDRRQLTVQCFVHEDEPDDVINGKLDRIMRVIDRQQAYYDLEAEMEGFDKVGNTLQHNLEALPIAESNTKKEIAELGIKLSEFEVALAAERQEGYSEWSKKGGRGTYEPKGFRLNKINALEAQIKTIKDAIEAKPKDDAQHRQEVAKNIAHFQQDLKKRRARVNELRAMLGKEPITAYKAEEDFKLPD